MSKVVPELLPCPFCGSAPIVHECEHGEIQIGCRECAVSPFTEIEARQDKAIAAWNTRAPTPPPATPVEGDWTWFSGHSGSPDWQAKAIDAINALRENNKWWRVERDDLRATASQQAAEIAEYRALRMGLAATQDKTSAVHRELLASNANMQQASHAYSALAMSLESALAACRGDAERYQWLRVQNHADIGMCWLLPHEQCTQSLYSPEAIDAAIDAAIRASKEAT